MPTLVPTSEELRPLAELLQRAMRRVEDRLARQLDSDLPPVARLLRHVERYRGKMVRPHLSILAALAATPDAARRGGAHDDADVTDAHVITAAVCEMIHLATLVHDDVLDEADTRRQAPTVNSLRGNEAAVILGDYLFSAAYHLCSQLDRQATALLVAQTGMTLCAGELLQLHHRENFSLDEATYYTIVDRKTASLIAAACQLGAARSGHDLEAPLPLALGAFGRALGVAFQIQDDLLDLTGDQAVVGKSLGKDAEKGKLTLPVIHHLACAGPSLRARTLELLAHAEAPAPALAGPAGPVASAAPGQAAAAREGLRTLLHETGSIDHARAVAERFVDDARAALAPVPDSPARRMLLTMAAAVVSRAF